MRRLRAGMQAAVLALVVWGGIDLWRFWQELQSGRVPPFAKPLSPEGFLPIGSFMSLRLWLTSGHFDPWHPAGLVIFAAALLLALLLRKSFCGWICPVGAISEALWRAGRRIFGRVWALPRWLDRPLRSLKYLLLAFFLLILLRMSPAAIRGFLETDYWKAGDLKMLLFFLAPGGTTLAVLGALVALSLATRAFWCRYLCPYGALLGLLALASPVRVRRDERHCIHCKRCTRNCPSLLPVEARTSIVSPECVGCLTCVSRCPAPGALDAVLVGRRAMPPALYAAAVAGVFVGVILVARATGHWQSGVSGEELLRIVPALRALAHP